MNKEINKNFLSACESLSKMFMEVVKSFNNVTFDHMKDVDKYFQKKMTEAKNNVLRDVDVYFGKLTTISHEIRELPNDDVVISFIISIFEDEKEGSPMLHRITLESRP